MSLRTFLFLLMILVIAWSGALVFLSTGYASGRLGELFSANNLPQSFGPAKLVLVSQAALFLVSMLALIAFLFWVFSYYVVQPLRTIIAGVEAFITRGERLDFSTLTHAPAEVKSLALSLTDFSQKVEQAHGLDAEVSRMKSDFISTAAHQLRTPLTGIRWALEALQKDPTLSEEQQTLVTSAVDKSHQLVSIVGTLLDISSIESGKYKYNFVTVDLVRLADDVVKGFNELSVRCQVSLVFVGPEEIIPQVRADKERITWVLSNIIENAIRYTPAGGTVQVSLATGAGRAYVHVRDTGIGIPEGDRGNIFERFYRAPNAVAKENGGNGLGLYIARTIATDHGGDLNFKSNTEGPGTTFSLSLPVSG